MKKRYLALLIIFIMFFITSCTGGNKNKTKAPGETTNGFFINHIFTGGKLTNGQEIREIKLNKGMGSEKLIIQFYNYSTTEKDAKKSKGIPMYDFNVNSNKSLGKLSFRHEVNIKSNMPDITSSKLINNISIQSTNQGEPSEIIIDFKEYTEYKVEEKSNNGQLIIYVRSQK